MALKGDWGKARQAIRQLSGRVDRALQLAVRDTAVELHKNWTQGIRKGTLDLEPNHPITRTAKQSSRPLMDHGDYVNSIHLHRASRYATFVGVHKNAKTKDGLRLVDIANVQEFGAVIRPKTAKSLAIPLTRKASRIGSPRNYPGLDFIPAKKGNRSGVVGVLAEKTRSEERTKGVRRKTRSAYLLKLWSKIPARPARQRSYEQTKRTWNPRIAFQRHLRASRGD